LTPVRKKKKLGKVRTRERKRLNWVRKVGEKKKNPQIIGGKCSPKTWMKKRGGGEKIKANPSKKTTEKKTWTFKKCRKPPNQTHRRRKKKEVGKKTNAEKEGWGGGRLGCKGKKRLVGQSTFRGGKNAVSLQKAN